MEPFTINIKSKKYHNALLIVFGVTSDERDLTFVDNFNAIQNTYVAFNLKF